MGSAHLHVSLDGPLVSKVGAISICVITGASVGCALSPSLATPRGVTAVPLLTQEENRPQRTCPRPLSSLSMAAVANYHKLSGLSPFIISASVGLGWLSALSHTETQEALGKVPLPAQSGRRQNAVLCGWKTEALFSYPLWAGDILSCWRPPCSLARGPSIGS